MDSSTRPQSYGFTKHQILQLGDLALLPSDWSSDVSAEILRTKEGEVLEIWTCSRLNEHVEVACPLLATGDRLSQAWYKWPSSANAPFSSKDVELMKPKVFLTGTRWIGTPLGEPKHAPTRCRQKSEHRGLPDYYRLRDHGESNIHIPLYHHHKFDLIRFPFIFIICR